MIDDISKDIKATTTCSTGALTEIESCEKDAVAAEVNRLARHLHKAQLINYTSNGETQGPLYIYTKRQGSRRNDDPQITLSKKDLNTT